MNMPSSGSLCNGDATATRRMCTQLAIDPHCVLRVASGLGGDPEPTGAIMKRVFFHRSRSDFSLPAHPRLTPFSGTHTGNSMLALVLFLVSVPTAWANGTWYVNRAHGSDNNDCKSRQHPCKTIGHAISLASSGDSILI